MKLVELVTRHREGILARLGEPPKGGSSRDRASSSGADQALGELAMSLATGSLTVPTSVIVATRLLDDFDPALSPGALVRAIFIEAEGNGATIAPAEACLLAELAAARPMSARAETSPSEARAHASAAAPRAVVAVSPAPRPTPPSSRGPLEGIEVLVVDDESDARELAAMVLTQAGASVREADCATNALEEVQTAPPDVIVSDIGMPGQDGHSLIRTIRSMPRPAGGIRAMALTAFARSEDRHRSLDAGFDMHLVKPIEPFSLVAAVSKLAGRDPTATV